MLTRFRILFSVIALCSPVIAPFGVGVCGGTLANLEMMDSGHPVDPCVDGLATLQTAVSSVTNYLGAVDVPPIDGTDLFVAMFISALLSQILSPKLLAFPPHTPPPRFSS